MTQKLNVAMLAGVSGTDGTINALVATLTPLIRAQLSTELMVSGDILLQLNGTARAGFLFMRGQTLLRAGTYANLFAAIGAYCGVGDGSTTFVLPNADGQHIRIFDSGGTIDGGRSIGSLEADAVGQHFHSVNMAVYQHECWRGWRPRCRRRRPAEHE